MELIRGNYRLLSDSVLCRILVLQNVNRYCVQKMFPGVNNIILKIIDEIKLTSYLFQENSVYIILQESLKGDCAVKHPPPASPFGSKTRKPFI